MGHFIGQNHSISEGKEKTLGSFVFSLKCEALSPEKVLECIAYTLYNIKPNIWIVE